MKKILPVIVISQFFCTSLWFAGNAILPNLVEYFHLQNANIAHFISAVQFGFITGTFTFALSGIVDRFVATRIFFLCSVLAAFCNTIIVILNTNEVILLVSRFLVGFFFSRNLSSRHENRFWPLPKRLRKVIRIIGRCFGFRNDFSTFFERI